jgi:hypothetical protein
MIDGKMTSQEMTDMQRNLNVEKEVFNNHSGTRCQLRAVRDHDGLCCQSSCASRSADTSSQRGACAS